MPERIPASKQAMDEALGLAEEIIKNIELDEIPLDRCALKSTRLARLLNDFEFAEVFKYEASGYPYEPNGMSSGNWKRGLISGRRYQKKKPNTEELETYMFLESIGTIETQLEVQKIALSAAQDGSISSANPNQYLKSSGNLLERNAIKLSIQENSARLASRRALIYDYASRQYYELRFSGIVDDVFSRIRQRVDGEIGSKVPEAVKRFSAVYENMRSENPEDISNAVHSCRRILQDLADSLYPAREDKIVGNGSKQKTIKLGADNYINRLMAYADENSDSSRFSEIVGSHLSFLGERLDSIFQAAQKGSHATITEKSEADRYVAYTYMVVGDLLSLGGESFESAA